MPARAAMVALDGGGADGHVVEGRRAHHHEKAEGGEHHVAHAPAAGGGDAHPGTDGQGQENDDAEEKRLVGGAHRLGGAPAEEAGRLADDRLSDHRHQRRDGLGHGVHQGRCGQGHRGSQASGHCRASPVRIELGGNGGRPDLHAVIPMGSREPRVRYSHRHQRPT